MKVLWSEKIRIFLVNRILTGFCGMTLSELLRLFRNHQFAIAPPYLPRAALMICTAIINSVIGLREDKMYTARVKDVEVEQPLIILGHRRSGTTHLHNLLAIDKRFAYPNVYQVLNPHTFLTTEKFAKFVRFVPPKTRIVDNISFGFEMPWEDEISTVGSLRSPLLWWVFPMWEDHYSKYYTFRDVPKEDIDLWREALLLFHKKLTWKYNRPLVLKSPPHTCRIKLLLDMYPDVRFVHIHRNPYNVFQSTKRQTIAMLRANRLHDLNPEHIDAIIIRRYKEMYDVFFEERKLIPEGRFYEVSYEELERDPIGQVRQIYENLSLPEFDAVQEPLERYVDSISNYQKNKYSQLPLSLRSQIAQSWQKSFEMCGYSP